MECGGFGSRWPLNGAEPKDEAVEAFDAPDLSSGIAPSTKGFAPDRFDFDLAPAFEIDQARRPVGSHRRSFGNVFFDQGIGEFVSQSVGGAEDFPHESAHPLREIRIGEDHVGGDASRGDGNAVEGDIPDKFLPAFPGEIRGDTAGDAGSFEGFAESVGSRSGCAGIFPEGDEPLGRMVEFARICPVDTHEAEPAEDPFGTVERGEILVRSEAVLKGQQEGVGF